MVEKDDNTGNNDANTLQKDANVAKAETGDASQSKEPVAEIEDFDQWLTH